MNSVRYCSRISGYSRAGCAEVFPPYIPGYRTESSRTTGPDLSRATGPKA